MTKQNERLLTLEERLAAAKDVLSLVPPPLPEEFMAASDKAQDSKTLEEVKDFLVRKCQDADLYDAFIEEFGLDDNLPTPDDVRGIMPDLTGGKSSEQYLKDRWRGK